MPKTLLAVDDSATMRRVLEITFGSDEFRVVTAENPQAALGKLIEGPGVAVIDTILGGEDGYALSKEIRKRDPNIAIVLLSSRHNPYDPGKGKDAGADDFMDKPFDTQQMVDKVKKVLAARDMGGNVQPPSSIATVIGVAPAPRPAAPPAPAPAPPPPAAPPPAAGAPAGGPALRPSVSRANTLMFGGELAPKPAPAAAAPPAQARPAPQPHAPAPTPVAPPVAARPAPQPASPQPPKVAPAPAAVHAAPTAPPLAPSAVPTAPPTGAVAAKVNGQLAGKLGDLGLTPQQVEGVLALSRDVVERVVWEVVPELAETLIKEEIARLMKP